MILITGASGFIGKHLLKALILNYGKENVIALTSLPLRNARYVLHKGYHFDEDYLLNEGCAEVETIIHAGAFIPKNNSNAAEVNFCNSNIASTASLLNSKFVKLRKVIYLSTIDIYSDEETISENSLISPVSLYGDSKLYCEKMITSWCNKNGLNSHILRIGHVYGPGEHKYQKLIPVTINKILNGSAIEIFGEGNDLRSYIYIRDVVKAIMNSISLKEDVGPINIVSANKITIKEVISKIIKISNTNSEILQFPALGKQRDLTFDNKKMRNHLLAVEEDFDIGLEEEWLTMKIDFEK